MRDSHRRGEPDFEIRQWVATRESISGILRLVMDAWSEDPDDPLSAFCEMCYVAHCLRHTSHGLAAYDGDGSMVGVCLMGAITNGHLHEDAMWAERENQLSSFLRSLVWWRERVSGTLSDIAEEDEVARRAMSMGLPLGAEMMLLVVDGRARGRGIGRRLVAEARRLAERRNWESMFLVTDTWCDWRVYEGWGFTRILTSPSPSDLSCLRMVYAFTPSQMPACDDANILTGEPSDQLTA